VIREMEHTSKRDQRKHLTVLRYDDKGNARVGHIPT
jgi:hypothetical protein